MLVRAQTSGAENGIYVWNGAATPMTRALDASTFDELEQATTTVEEGTSAGTTYRQTAVNGTLGEAFTLNVPVVAVTQALGAELGVPLKARAGAPAEQRPDDRHPRVAPVGVALPRDGQQRVRESRAEVARWSVDSEDLLLGVDSETTALGLAAVDDELHRLHHFLGLA